MWSHHLGLESLSVDKWRLRRDLTGVTFSSSTRHILPFVKVLDVDRGSPPPGYKARNPPPSVLRPLPVQIDVTSSVAQVYLGPSLIGDIWGLLQQNLNFSYNMVDIVTLTIQESLFQINSVDNNFGALQPDGSYDGVVSLSLISTYNLSPACTQIGMVHRNEVDFGVTNFYANQERAQVVDLSTILDYQGYPSK